MATLQSTLRVSLLDDVSKRAKAITGSLRGLHAQSTQFVNPLRSLTVQAGGLIGAYMGVTGGFQGTYKAAADTQAALTEVGIKANLSRNELGRLQTQLKALAPQVNQTTTDLLAGVDVMTTMGASAQEAAGAIPAIGKTATATGSAIADLSGASVSAMQNLNVMPAQIQQMLEGMAQAGNAGAFEMRDMAQYFPQLTASARALGMRGVPAVNDMAAALQIARRGAGDASSAATNLSNFMSKIISPQTSKNFKKFGVDVTKELEKANKKGISPIQHFIEVLNKVTKGGRSDLVSQIFGDEQVLSFVRPMLADFQDYLRIRGEADRANGVIADAYARRMDDANQKVKAFQIGISNLGTSIGSHLLQPVGDAASYLADVLNTLDSRVTIFDRVRIASEGFVSGLGFKDGELVAIAKEWRDFIFGVEDGSKAADQAGQIFQQFREWGDDVGYLTRAIAENPIGRFLGDLAPYGLQIAAWSMGIGLLAGSVRTLAGALFVLSGASALVGTLKTVGAIAALVGGGSAATGATVGGAAAAIGTGGLAARLLGATRLGVGGMALAGGVIAGREAYTGDTPYARGQALLPSPTDALNKAEKLWSWGQSSPLPGVADTLALDNVRRARAMGFGGGTTGALPGKAADDVVRIDAQSIAEMSRPTGTQDVRVTNPQPPSLTVHAPISISGISDPQAAAAAAAARLGDAVRSAYDAADTD